MGHFNFRPQGVWKLANQLLATRALKRVPSWFDVVGTNPPSQILVRTRPHQHLDHQKQNRRKKPSKMFTPQPITYEEDILREEFFKDHPWELARPRLVLEDDGLNAEKVDWSKPRQPGRPVNGESVVQRQLYIMRSQPGTTKQAAYDMARQEFYSQRLQEDIERRVAREEAQSTGAYFGKSTLKVGMELEDQKYEEFKVWAMKENEELILRRSAMRSADTDASDSDSVEADAAEEMEIMAELSPTKPAVDTP